MHVRPNFEYNRFCDDVVGHEDVGSGNTTTKRAESLLMFLIRGLFGGWTEIIGYHFTVAAFSKDRLKTLLYEYLAALESANIVCRAIVCDQEPSHVSLFKGLGVTSDTPYVKCPFSGRRVYVIYDPPHLLKSTRNNFLNYDFKVNDKCKRC